MNDYKQTLNSVLNPILAENLQVCPEIAHAFFDRIGGVSKGVFSSLNVSYKVEDDANNVTANRKIIVNYFNQQSQIPKYLITLNQIHSAKVVIVSNNITPQLKDLILSESQNFSLYNTQKNISQGLPANSEGDALVTDNPSLILGVTTADCAPILLFHLQPLLIAAIHAGHSGAFLGILSNTVKAFTALGAKAESIIAAIGPAIQQSSYEVDQVFFERFMQQNPENKRFFIDNPTNPKHYFFSLSSYVFAKLTALGLYNINVSNLDTFTNPNRFFSHRLATKNHQKRGVQLSAIAIKQPNN